MLKFPNIDPVILTIGPLAIRWYSLAYIAGVILGWQYLVRIVKHFPNGIQKQHIDDFVSWIIISIIVGGRLGYVMFYEPGRFLLQPIDILKTYEGGMSFHGGVIGGIVAVYLFTKKHRISFWAFSDLLVAAAPIGLFFGRIANFINGELYGRATQMPWGVIFPYTDGQPRHPSQLYEALLEGALLFIIIYIAIIKGRLQRPGYITGLFLTMYAISRMFVECFRQPDAQIGFIADYLTMGQLLCLPMLLLGIYLLTYQGNKYGN